MEPHPSTLAKQWGLKNPPDRQSVVRAYRKQAQYLHPDRAGNTSQANERFIQLRQEYQLLLRYSSDPEAFAHRAPPQPDRPPPPRPNPSPSIQVSPKGWSIPAGNITLRRLWPLTKVWEGGKMVVDFSRGYPCACKTGCPYCKGALMRFERVRLEVGVPPLSNPAQKVRLPGMGHRGDVDQGNVIIELVWMGKRGWKWTGQGLTRKLRVCRTAQWGYCRAPSGLWFRIAPAHSDPHWISASGLRASVELVHCRRWAALLQIIPALCWALSQKSSIFTRLSLAWQSLFHTW